MLMTILKCFAMIGVSPMTELQRRIAQELAKPVIKTRAATILENATRALEELPPALKAIGTPVQPIREIRGVRQYRQLEHEMQAAFFTWASSFYIPKIYPELEDMYAIPNGTYSSAKSAARAKREGLKPGTPDIHLPHARGAYIGWWCEFKAGKNQPSEHQKHKLKRLHQAGHAVTVHWDLHSAQLSVQIYLERGERVGLPKFLEGIEHVPPNNLKHDSD
jgi:hypothetical protein